MTTPDLIASMSEALLTNIAADLVAAGLAAPARKILTHGPPARDCGQLAVWWQSIQPSQGGRTLPVGQYIEGVGLTVTHVVTFAVDLTLCPASSPRAKAPTQVEATASGVLGASYAWVLYRSLARRWVAGTVFDPVRVARPGKSGMPPTVPAPQVDGGFLVVQTSFPFNVED